MHDEKVDGVQRPGLIQLVQSLETIDEAPSYLRKCCGVKVWGNFLMNLRRQPLGGFNKSLDVLGVNGNLYLATLGSR